MSCALSHRVQDVAWGGVLLSHGGSWARSLPKADLWPLVVLPPIVGALGHELFNAPPQGPPTETPHVNGKLPVCLSQCATHHPLL